MTLGRGRKGAAAVDFPLLAFRSTVQLGRMRKKTYTPKPSLLNWSDLKSDFRQRETPFVEGCLKDDIRMDISPDVVKLKLGGIIVESRKKPAFAGGSDCDGERRGGRGGAIVVWSDQLDSWGQALPLEREGGSERVKGIQIRDLMQENNWDD